MKRIFIFFAVGLFTLAVQAQDEDSTEYEVLLPDDAQKCVLPAAPDSIPADATLDQLKMAKKDIGEFQGKVTGFRDCLAEAEQNPDNTPGNKQAIVDSYNYSVEMEERVASRFNEAVRDYKERKAAAEG